MLKLVPTKGVLKFMEKLPPKQYAQVAKKFFSLLNDPSPHDSTKLEGYDYYRANVGEYRIVYVADKEELRLVVVGKRNDAEVYGMLKRLKKGKSKKQYI